uniref:Uncharacterized protein n=1 Tax=viral metagenome TaxID=1070528 RepID=A0A6C0JXR3_9ZZZZ
MDVSGNTIDVSGNTLDVSGSSVPDPIVSTVSKTSERCAILFTGRVKSWEDQEIYLRQMQDDIKESTGLDVDLFCSAGCYEDTFNAFVGKLGVISSQYTTYVESPDLSGYPVAPGVIKYNMESMFYHFKNVYALMENYGLANNITYKLVVRWRADIICTAPYKPVWPIPLNTLYIPEGNDNGGINVESFYGECGAMKSVHELWDSFKTYCQDGMPIQGETFFEKRIEEYGILTTRYPLACSLNPNRQ